MLDEEEVELVPVSPLRRLEKRIERLENYSSEDPKSIMKDIVDIVRMNQQIVDEMAKSNDALRIELSKLPGRLDQLVMEVRELISFIKSSGEEEVTTMAQDSVRPLVDKLDELVKSNKSMNEKNEVMLSIISDLEKKVRKPMNPSAMLPSRIQRPLLPPRPLIRKLGQM